MAERGAFVDPDGIAAFWRDEYLRSYVAEGGSAVKWLRGREGSGKTRLLREMRQVAAAEGYLTADVSAREVRIGRFDELYRAILGGISLDAIALPFAVEAARRAGAAEFRPGQDGDLEAYLVARGRPQAAVAADLAGALDFLYAEPRISPPVATALRHLAYAWLRPGYAQDLGHREAAAAWMSGAKVSATLRRRSGIGMALDRFGAREILRSLLHARRLVGGKGLVLTIDDMDALLGGEGPARYTRLRRDDAFEAIRELIDEGPGMPGLFVLFAGRPEVFDDERAGLLSYAALAMRIEPEVESSRPNPFDDVKDLDVVWRRNWPAWRAALAEAYGASPQAVLESGSLVAMGPISPVKLLVEAIAGREADTVGA